VAEEAEVTISLSGLKERVLIYGFALLVGGATVVDLVSPHGRNDPFTGTEGDVLADRITTVEFLVDDLVHRAGVCTDRVNAHLKVSESKINEYDVRLAKAELHISECLQRTGVLRQGNGYDLR
jgi:hypothetical protein